MQISGMSERTVVAKVSTMLEKAGHQLHKGPDDLYVTSCHIQTLMSCPLLTLLEGCMLSLASLPLQVIIILSEMNGNQHCHYHLPPYGWKVVTPPQVISAISSSVKPSLLPGYSWGTCLCTGVLSSLPHPPQGHPWQLQCPLSPSPHRFPSKQPFCTLAAPLLEGSMPSHRFIATEAFTPLPGRDS